MEAEWIWSISSIVANHLYITNIIVSAMLRGSLWKALNFPVVTFWFFRNDDSVSNF